MDAVLFMLSDKCLTVSLKIAGIKLALLFFKLFQNLFQGNDPFVTQFPPACWALITSLVELLPAGKA